MNDDEVEYVVDYHHHIYKNNNELAELREEVHHQNNQLEVPKESGIKKMS